MSTLAFFINQLDALDETLYEPLFSTTFGRDINMRSGVTLANESVSFIRSAYGSIGTQKATGKPWITPHSSTLPGVSVDGALITTPMRLLGQAVSYDAVELMRSQELRRPIDVTRYNAMNAIYQMGTDEQVYVGDVDTGDKGLCNSPLVTVGAVANGAGGTSTWETKTPDEILADVNEMIESAWEATGHAVCPDKVLLPAKQFAYISSQKVSQAGNVSILKFLKENSIALEVNGRQLDIKSTKWLKGIGAGGTHRMMAYTNQERFVRFPMVPIQRMTPYFHDGIKYTAPYIYAYGSVEFVYPETVIYRDGI